MIIITKKYVNFEISVVRTGVYNKIIIRHNGIMTATIYGFLLPHFVLVRSDNAPNRGSLNAFQTDQIIKPTVI